MSRPPNTSSKTVFALGAGFSREAGFPLQDGILDRVRSLDLMDAPPGALDKFIADQAEVLDFLREVFAPGQTPTLEDVFTLLDQTIASRAFCAGYAWNKLDEVRDALRRAVLLPFHAAGQALDSKAAGFYRSAAAHLVHRRIAAGQHADPFSIVSLNWDCLLEDSIYWCVRELGEPQRVDVDYCCYTTKLTETCTHTPSVLQKATGLFNVKVMKLHGSANWLVCPNCNRLFTGLGADESVWELYVLPRACPECEKLLADRPGAPEKGEPRLEPFFVTPTFVKVFDNPHIRMTWHNAYMDLAEAREVVFIGYSLPEADYHVRTLLRRAIRPDARIVVVLTGKDDHSKSTPKHLRRFFPVNRYRSFFGPDRPTFVTSGVRGYFEQVAGITELPERIDAVQRLLA